MIVCLICSHYYIIFTIEYIVLYWWCQQYGWAECWVLSRIECLLQKMAAGYCSVVTLCNCVFGISILRPLDFRFIFYIIFFCCSFCMKTPPHLSSVCGWFHFHHTVISSHYYKTVCWFHRWMYGEERQRILFNAICDYITQFHSCNNERLNLWAVGTFFAFFISFGFFFCCNSVRLTLASRQHSYPVSVMVKCSISVANLYPTDNGISFSLYRFHSFIRLKALASSLVHS